MTERIIRVSPYLAVTVWYDRHSRLWSARYIDNAGNQVGDAWYDGDRDSVLVNRPEASRIHTTR